jgi:RNA polymerase sigma-70 factor (ECF subfamily)
MTPDHERDEWLMAQVALGNRDSLDALIRRYATRLLTFLDRMIGDRHRSEELVQEVFLAIWKSRKQYQFPRPFRAWLYAIAINKGRADLRARAPRHVSLEEDVEVSSAAQSSPLDAAISTETATALMQAVTRLPTLQRAVVVLRNWESLSYAEIGVILGRREATVRAHMHYGLAALRNYLEPRLGG